MGIPGSIPVAESRSTFAADLGRCALWVVWQSIRLPLFLFFLRVLEPVVTFVLGVSALLGVLTALFWKFESSSPARGRIARTTKLGSSRRTVWRREAVKRLICDSKRMTQDVAAEQW
jgi:hypothetical protein